MLVRGCIRYRSNLIGSFCGSRTGIPFLLKRNYCVNKFGLGPRFEKYKPELKGDPVELGEETEKEYEAKALELDPDRKFKSPENVSSFIKDKLAVLPKPSQVIKLEDEILRYYSPEEFFGVSKPDLQKLRDVVSGRSNEPLPRIQTTRRLDRKSFKQLVTLQGRKNAANQAFRTLEIMQDLGMDVDQDIYTSVISACRREEDVPKARELFESMLLEGIPLNVSCLTAMMTCYTRNLQLDEAYTLMRTYALGPERIIEPDNAIFTTLIRGCVRKKNFQLAWDTFDMMRQFYLEADTIAFNLMIDVCAQQYEAERAFNLYDEIKFLNLPYTEFTFHAMLRVCSRRFDYFHKAFEIFEQMKESGFAPNVESFHLLLAACGPVGNIEAADLVLDYMEKQNIPITIKTYNIMFTVLSRTIQKTSHPRGRKAILHRADIVFKQIQKYALDRKASGDLLVPDDDTITTTTLNTYINTYAEALHLRQVESLLNLYDEFGLQKDMYTYTKLLKMYSKARRVEQCFDVYRQMKQNNIVVDKFVWVHLMNACARAKYYNNGFKILRLMIANDLEITRDHIHLFYRALASNKLPELNELKELVWPYPQCRVFFLRPPPAYPTHPEPHGHVRPGEIKRKLKGKRWKKKSSNRKNKPKSK